MGDVERFILEIIGYLATGVAVYMLNRRDTANKLAAARTGTEKQHSQTTNAVSDAVRRIDAETEARKSAELKVSVLTTTLTTERETMINYRATTSEQLIALADKVDRQRGEINKLNEEVAYLRAERDGLRIERDRIARERDQSLNEVATLSGKLTAAERRLELAEQQIVDLRIQNTASDLIMSKLNISLVATVKEPEPNHVPQA